MLYSHPDVGMAMTVKDAIRLAIEKKGLLTSDPVSVENLEKIRQSIYDLNDPSRQEAQADPMMTLMNAMLSSSSGQGSGNTIEDSLQYIEELQNASRI
ncbi:hypothetical protein ACFL15_00220 [Patescibacteria group bacterium]